MTTGQQIHRSEYASDRYPRGTRQLHVSLTSVFRFALRNPDQGGTNKKIKEQHADMLFWKERSGSSGLPNMQIQIIHVPS